MFRPDTVVAPLNILNWKRVNPEPVQRTPNPIPRADPPKTSVANFRLIASSWLGLSLIGECSWNEGEREEKGEKREGKKKRGNSAKSNSREEKNFHLLLSSDVDLRREAREHRFPFSF